MSTLESGPGVDIAHAVAHAHGHAVHHELSFLRKYVFSRPQGHRHPVPVLHAAVLLVGGLLALAVRWQVAWPWSHMPVIGGCSSPKGGRSRPSSTPCCSPCTPR